MSSLNTFNNGSSMSALSENFSTMNVSSMPVTSSYSGQSSYSTVLPSSTTYVSSVPSTTTTILPASTTSTYVTSTVPVTTSTSYVSAAPLVTPMAAPMAAPSNMLPAPINDGTRYARLTGQKSRTKRSRRLLVQPLNGTGLQTLPAGVPAEGVQAAQAALASGVAAPVNMLPAPINDGTRYARLTGQKSRTQRSRRLLVQPLNGTGLQTLPAGVPAEQIGAAPVLGRRARRTLARQNQMGLNNGLATGMPLAGAMPLSSGLGQPLNALAAPHLTQVPLGAAQLSRSQKRNMRRRNARAATGGMLAPPAMASSNVLSQPSMMSQQPMLAQPLMTKQETFIAQPASVVGIPIL